MFLSYSGLILIYTSSISRLTGYQWHPPYIWSGTSPVSFTLWIYKTRCSDPPSVNLVTPPDTCNVRGNPALLYSTIVWFVNANVTHVTIISVGSPGMWQWTDHILKLNIHGKLHKSWKWLLIEVGVREIRDSWNRNFICRNLQFVYNESTSWNSAHQTKISWKHCLHDMLAVFIKYAGQRA